MEEGTLPNPPPPPHPCHIPPPKQPQRVPRPKPTTASPQPPPWGNGACGLPPRVARPYCRRAECCWVMYHLNVTINLPHYPHCSHIVSYVPHMRPACNPVFPFYNIGASLTPSDGLGCISFFFSNRSIVEETTILKPQ